MEKFNSFLIALVMLPFLLFMGGCKNKTLLIQSKWGQSGFEGIQSLLDRSRPMTYLEDERMNIGVQNDADSLYLILRTSDKNIRNQVKYGGLIIWLDGTANEVKKFGIQYPLGSTFTGIPPSGNKLGGRGEKPHSD